MKNQKPKKIGRKTKLTPEVQTAIVQAVARGLPYCHARRLAGVGRSTFFNWMALGENLRVGTLYRDFRDAVKRADAQFVVEALGHIQAAGKKQWQAYAWLLERRFPEDFGRREYVDHRVEAMDDSEEFF